MEVISAGNVVFQVENRKSRDDGGPSIQVRTNEDGEGAQLLRFDCFHVKPHYHYAPEGLNAEYNIDPTLVRDSLGWVISQIRGNIADMVDRAGYPAVSQALDPAAVEAGLAQVEAYFVASKAAAS